MSRSWRLPLLAATCALATACGAAPQSNGVASLSAGNKPAAETGKPDGKSDADKAEAWTKCMHEHGVDADAKVGPDGKIQMRVREGASASGGGGEKGTAGPGSEADKACRPLLPNGGQPPKLDAKQLDDMRKQAKCMRDHGIDVKDPDPNNPGFSVNLNGNDQKKVEDAMKACGMGMFGAGAPETAPK